MKRVEKLKEFLEENPKDCFVLHALGLEYEKQGELEEAQKYFLRVLDTDPDYVGTYYHLGKLYESQAKEEMALDTYNKGIEVAQKLKDKHSQSELETAVWELEE